MTTRVSGRLGSPLMGLLRLTQSSRPFPVMDVLDLATRAHSAAADIFRLKSTSAIRFN
jgi:hypothetical protein